MTLQSISLSQLVPSKANPRKLFDGAALKGLAASIRSDGLLQNLVVTPSKGKKKGFAIISGERRYRAMKLLEGRGELPEEFTVPVEVRSDLSKEGRLRLATVENLQRADLTPLEQTAALTKLVKGIITNIPHEQNMPALQLERKVLEINDLIEPRLRSALESDFGVNLKRLDLSTIEFDKESEEYQRLITVTRLQQEKTTVAQTDVGIQNLQDTQRINAENMEESLRIQREELQRAQKLTTEGQNMTAHQLNQQTEVAKKAAESMGTMGHGGGGGMDPGSMMASMAMGGAVGSGMAGMMGSMMQGMGQQPPVPPPTPRVAYMVAVGGKQAGPYTLDQLGQFVASGEFTTQIHVWKQGMANWVRAGDVEELAPLFQANSPPPPPQE